MSYDHAEVFLMTISQHRRTSGREPGGSVQGPRVWVIFKTWPQTDILPLPSSAQSFIQANDNKDVVAKCLGSNVRPTPSEQGTLIMLLSLPVSIFSHGQHNS